MYLLTYYSDLTKRDIELVCTKTALVEQLLRITNKEASGFYTGIKWLEVDQISESQAYGNDCPSGVM